MKKLNIYIFIYIYDVSVVALLWCPIIINSQCNLFVHVSAGVVTPA